MNRQLNYLKQNFRALVTVIKSGSIWEITVPKLSRTEFTQTSLVAELHNRLMIVHDNGSCNHGEAFSRPHQLQRHIHRLMLANHVELIGNRFYAVKFLASEPRGLINGVKTMVNFLTTVDQLLKSRI